MKNTFKKLLLCFLAASAVITGSAAAMSTGHSDGSNTRPEKTDIAAASASDYCLRDWQGYIAVFEGAGDTPKTVTEIPTETLNNVDRAKLKTGIRAETREELLSLLEDLSS